MGDNCKEQKRGASSLAGRLDRVLEYDFRFTLFGDMTIERIPAATGQAL